MGLLNSLSEEVGRVGLLLFISLVVPNPTGAQDILDFPNRLNDKEKFRGDTSFFQFKTSGIKSNSHITKGHEYGLVLPVNKKTKSVYIEFLLELEINPSSVNYINLILSDDSGYHKIQIGDKNDGLTYSLNENILIQKSDIFTQKKSYSLFRISIDSIASIRIQDLIDFNNHTDIFKNISLNNLREIKFEISQSGIGAIGSHKLNYLKIGSKKWDNQSPVFLEKRQIGNHNIEFTFDEIISNLNPPFFTLENALIKYYWMSPNKIMLECSQSNSKLIGKKISIHCSDIWGNKLSDTVNVSLFYLDTPVFGDLLITEILFDSSPSYGHLPEFEFIELKNVSNKSIDLSSLYWKHNKQLYPFDTGRIYSNQVLVFGKYDWQNSWYKKELKFPNLYASGGHIQLLNSYDQIITQLEYSPDYFRQEFKDGGVSLERISVSQKDELNLDCLNGIRGSPGRAELNKSKILDCKLLDYYFNRDSLILNWNRNLFSPQFISVVHNNDTFYIEFSGNRRILSIESKKLQQSVDSIEVTFIDCDSNIISQKILPREIDYSRIDFNEIHFETDESTDFIELINLGKSAVLLEDIDILFYNHQRRLVQVLPLINSKKLSIMPGEILAFCKSPIKLKQDKYYWNKISLPRFPNLSKEGAILKIQHHIWGTIDELEYNSRQYTHLDQDTHSLEKLSPDLYSNHPSNWRSSIENPTPGAKNSIINSNLNSDLNFIRSDITKIVLPYDKNIKISYNQNNGIAYVSIDLYTIQGVFLFQLWNLKSINKSGSYSIPLNSNFKNLQTANYILKFEIIYPNNRSKIYKQRISIFNDF